MSDEHRDRILDQFTRQAVPFSTAPAIRNEAALRRIVEMTEAGPEDESLDVACGPGLLVCAFGRVVRHATGIDLTPAMLDQARQLQEKAGLVNVTWLLGEATPLPFPVAAFSIVTARFAFHHFEDPAAALREMVRVCRPGGRIVVADSAPAKEKADSFNAMERLRDPSHTRALPLEEHIRIFEEAGLAVTATASYRLEGELEDLLTRSFPEEGDADVIRRMFRDSLREDALDMAPRSNREAIYFGFPVAMIVGVKADSGGL